MSNTITIGALRLVEWPREDDTHVDVRTFRGSVGGMSITPAEWQSLLAVAAVVEAAKKWRESCRREGDATMTPSDRARLVELCERATRLPWYARGRHLSLVPDSSGMGGTLPTNHIGNFAEPDDCAFAAHARSALPDLLAENEKLRALCREAIEISARLNHYDEYSPLDADRLDAIHEELSND